MTVISVSPLRKSRFLRRKISTLRSYKKKLFTKAKIVCQEALYLLDESTLTHTHSNILSHTHRHMHTHTHQYYSILYVVSFNLIGGMVVCSSVCMKSGVEKSPLVPDLEFLIDRSFILSAFLLIFRRLHRKITLCTSPDCRFNSPTVSPTQ